MNNPICRLLMLSLSITLTLVLNAQSDISIITYDQKVEIQEALERFPSKTEISIAIINGDEVDFIGYRKVGDTLKQVINHQSVFEIGSISKVFTSTLLAGFSQEGKLNLDDPIKDYLDLEMNIHKDITLKNLSNHTSGLPRLPMNLMFTMDPLNPYKSYGKEQLEEYLTSDINSSIEPGEKYQYSNLGAGLLGFILAEISGQTYEELLQQRIFSKYEMFNSTTLRKSVQDRLVQGLDATGKETPNWDFISLVGAGGILSSVEDMSQFVKVGFSLDNKALDLTHQSTYYLNENMDIGLGWHLPISKSGDRLIWHNGGTGGYTSSMAMNKEKKIGVVILTNISAFNQDMGVVDKLCFSLIETAGSED